MFNYFYNGEVSNFSFFKLPKILFTSKFNFTLDAKILYTIMLDRLSMSSINGWVDEKNRLYIRFSLTSVIDILGCGRNKALRLFDELEENKLILRVRQGRGKENIIYVFNINSVNLSNCIEEPVSVKAINKPVDNSINSDGEAVSETNQSSVILKKGVVPKPNQSSTVLNKEVVPKQNQSSLNMDTEVVSKSNQSSLISECKAVSKPNSNNNFNNTIINKKISNNPIENNEIKNYDMTLLKIKNNIEYDRFIKNGVKTDEINEIIKIMADVVCSSKSMYINGRCLSPDIISTRFLNLGYDEVLSVLKTFSYNKNKINNRSKYLITLLYNAKPLKSDGGFKQKKDYSGGEELCL